ncbi:MAG: MGMT family protein [candidate division KSB1 bacterium]|nr:MGMT family protein [candidate division KSB1 bacterium]
MTTKKSWHEKLADGKNLPKIIVCDASMKIAMRWGLKPGDTFVIGKPLDVDAIMRRVPAGKLLTINEVRKALAAQYGTTTACPITTGIFCWIAAYAAEEELQEGKSDVTPYWRILKSDGEVNQKYPGGVDLQKQRLEAEGHRLVQKGKKWIVENYRQALVKI